MGSSQAYSKSIRKWCQHNLQIGCFWKEYHLGSKCRGPVDKPQYCSKVLSHHRRRSHLSYRSKKWSHSNSRTPVYRAARIRRARIGCCVDSVVGTVPNRRTSLHPDTHPNLLFNMLRAKTLASNATSLRRLATSATCSTCKSPSGETWMFECRPSTAILMPANSQSNELSLLLQQVGQHQILR